MLGLAKTHLSAMHGPMSRGRNGVGVAWWDGWQRAESCLVARSDWAGLTCAGECLATRILASDSFRPGLCCNVRAGAASHVTQIPRVPPSPVAAPRRAGRGMDRPAAAVRTPSHVEPRARKFDGAPSASLRCRDGVVSVARCGRFAGETRGSVWRARGQVGGEGEGV